MLIRIIKGGPGCSWQPGTLIKIPDKRAKYYIGQGFAVAGDANDKRLDGSLVPDAPVVQMMKANTVTSTIPVVRMEPPRHICGCGLVCESAAALEEHRRLC